MTTPKTPIQEIQAVLVNIKDVPPPAEVVAMLNKTAEKMNDMLSALYTAQNKMKNSMPLLKGKVVTGDPKKVASELESTIAALDKQNESLARIQKEMVNLSILTGQIPKGTNLETIKNALEGLKIELKILHNENNTLKKGAKERANEVLDSSSIPAPKK